MNQIDIKLDIVPPSVTHQSKKIVRVGNHCKLANTKQLNAVIDSYTALLRPYVPEKPMKGPININMWFTYPLTKKRKAGNLFKTTKPDWDNLAKTLQDVMTKLGFWYDDSQVVFALVCKGYGDKGCIIVRVVELPEV